MTQSLLKVYWYPTILKLRLVPFSSPCTLTRVRNSEECVLLYALNNLKTTGQIFMKSYSQGHSYFATAGIPPIS
jgi:hypothetical protein